MKGEWVRALDGKPAFLGVDGRLLRNDAQGRIFAVNPALLPRSKRGHSKLWMFLVPFGAMAVGCIGISLIPGIFSMSLINIGNPAEAVSGMSNINSFGGYVLNGPPFSEIGGSCKVPKILQSSPAGLAATWIGAQNGNSDFIQLGVVEERISILASFNLYYVFWSDRDLGYHPQRIGIVSAGDQMAFKMTESAAGWNLSYTDETTGSSHSLNTSYGSGVGFNYAEWTQEDPSKNAQVASNLSYAATSPISFTSLTINGSPPPITPLDAQTLADHWTDTYLVPTPFANDGFEINSADAYQKQYLQDVASYNVSLASVIASVDNNGNVTSLNGGAIPAFVTATQNFNQGLSSHSWPQNASRDINNLVAHNSQLISDMQSWESAGYSPTSQAVGNVMGDINVDGHFSVPVRADLALPPR